MKTFSNYRKTFFSLLATSLISCSFLVACDKDDDDIDEGQVYVLSGTASGAKEIPTNTTTGSASLTGSFNKRTNLLSYVINWTGLSGNITAAHFHGPATATETANPMLDITVRTNGTSGTASGSMTVTDAFEDALLNGKIYYNLHTALYPNGEVRSQAGATLQ